MDRALAWPLIVALVALLTACSPQTPDHESWTDSALQALEDSASEVATAELLLRQVRDDRVTRSYEKVVALDADEAAGTIAESFGAKQPPPEDDAEYRRVTTALSDAADLLADVRIAVERSDTSEYADLLEQLGKVADDLDSTRREVGAG
jgi:hypothetical protein